MGRMAIAGMRLRMLRRRTPWRPRLPNNSCPKPTPPCSRRLSLAAHDARTLPRRGPCPRRSQAPELAAPILKELVDLNLNDDQRRAVDDFGSHRLLQLARTAALAPAGAEFAEACLTAAEAKTRDPQRIAQLINQLTSPTAAARTAARVDLAASGEPAVVATLEALARETNPQRRSAIASAVVAMDPTAVDPLLGMLSTNDPTLRRGVIRILKAMNVTLAKPFIAHGDFDRQRRAPARRRDWPQQAPACAVRDRRERHRQTLALGRCDEETRRHPLPGR